LKFDEAAALLGAGRFAAALRAFEEILSANPANKRAAALRQVLLEASQRHGQKLLEATSRPARRSSLLYRQIPLFDPDRLFTSLAPRLSWIWTRAFLSVYVAVVAAAGVVLARHYTPLVQALPSLSSVSWAGGLLVALVLLVAFHESAHGLTCKHFGGKVPEGGFLLILFVLPAVYVDVSDAWLFRRRRERALVGLAGPMWDLLATALGILGWWALPVGRAEAAATVITIASGASFLINMNPLLRLDGYYILSDLSGIPNLRQVALSAAHRGVGALFGKKSEAPPLSGRARLFVLVYGLLSAAYIAFVIALLFSMLTGFSTRLAGLWGPVLIVGLVGYLLRKPLRAISIGIAHKLTHLSLRGAVSLAASATALGAIGLVPWTLKISGPAQLEASQLASVRPEVSGALAEVLVREGDAVRRGQLVARLDRSELEAKLTMTEAELSRANAQLSILARGPEREQVRQAREHVRAARAEVEHLRSRFERYTRLRDEGLVSADLHEQVRTELSVQEGSLRAALDQAALIERGARPEEITAARADVERLSAQRDDIERQLEALELSAPADGIVVTPDLDQRLGERIAAGGVLLEVAEAETLAAEVQVLESEIGDVQIGQPVRLRFAAYPDRTFEGKVTAVAPVAERDGFGRPVFRVRCAVNDLEQTLRPGMTGAAKIIGASQPVARLFVRRMLRLVDVSLF
ncbi:MAG: efflux RND transporter periplasmic adaptor subunit, partial [Acidobacteriota bacterium]